MRVPEGPDTHPILSGQVWNIQFSIGSIQWMQSGLANGQFDKAEMPCLNDTSHL
jgi:hypothetical protein